MGSSSVVTDKNGKFHEHLEYFPYGETWIIDRANNEDLPYKFTGKELDPETGLYFYGARYYDAKLSRWISADPPLATGEYLPVPPIFKEAKDKNSKLPGMGGVFNAINLDGYQYAGQNPVKFVDPDGNAFAKKRSDGKYSYIRSCKATDLANSIVSWYPGGAMLANKITGTLGGFERIASFYDEPEFLSALLDANTINSTIWGAVKFSNEILKTASKIASVLGVIGNGYSTGSAIVKNRAYQNLVESVIEGMGLLDGYDKDFICIIAPAVEKRVQSIVKNEDINVDFNMLGNTKDNSKIQLSKKAYKELNSLANDIKIAEKKWNSKD